MIYQLRTRRSMKKIEKDDIKDILYLAVIVAFWIIIAFYLAACAGPRGHDGSSIVGPVGPSGETGAVGPKGPSGSTGAQGPAGTGVAAVKFCSQTAYYPSVFPEYGLCLNQQLFAVYSTNGGYLAYIPNGSYYSNAVGSQCNFHVSGCSVSDF